MLTCLWLTVIGYASLYTSAALLDSVEFYDPNANGGSMLDYVGPGVGEPLNVIVSGQSSPAVLTNGGIVNFAKAVGFSDECLNIHKGGPQAANLGDGHDLVNQTMLLREDYGDPIFGTCMESLIGGNHFRVWRQNGDAANSGALFLAVSHEEDLAHEHTISPDGYNKGRDLFIAGAVGNKSYGGVKYSTVARNITGLLKAGSDGVNHGIAVDGITTLLTITIV
ncbi:hypothetical protein CPB83DRAFT_853053 [Crepidotus variabilis]|uniref:Uncharacterized protein n=1 Tax=Crepidotus variabilis TaxID=179855 RepID=A0A9P6JQX7_9AGAR|nr:hypothetical protein CPB83DRAFT_853053 [Crepidotus variabilis]